jgi:hypothetical protein
LSNSASSKMFLTALFSLEFGGNTGLYGGLTLTAAQTFMFFSLSLCLSVSLLICFYVSLWVCVFQSHTHTHTHTHIRTPISGLEYVLLQCYYSPTFSPKWLLVISLVSSLPYKALLSTKMIFQRVTQGFSICSKEDLSQTLSLHFTVSEYTGKYWRNFARSQAFQMGNTPNVESIASLFLKKQMVYSHFLDMYTGRVPLCLSFLALQTVRPCL